MGFFLHPRAVHVLLRIQQDSSFYLCYLGFVVCILHYKRRKQCSPADTVKYLLLNDLWCVVIVRNISKVQRVTALSKWFMNIYRFVSHSFFTLDSRLFVETAKPGPHSYGEQLSKILPRCKRIALANVAAVVL